MEEGVKTRINLMMKVDEKFLQNNKSFGFDKLTL